MKMIAILSVGLVACATVPDANAIEQVDQSFSSDQLRSWRYYYPMDRGQVRGQRAGNPWASFSGQNNSIIAQLTWRLPSDPSDSAMSNRPNSTYPSTVAALPPYYFAQPVEYYVNWWCQYSDGLFDPVQHNCAGLDYRELISEMPDISGNAAFFLGLWAAGIKSSYNLYYETSICDLLDSTSVTSSTKTAALSDPTRRRPQLFGLPATSRPAFFAPPTCTVTFKNDMTTSFDDKTGYGKGYIATAVRSEFSSLHGYVLGLANFYYGETAKTACLSMPVGSPVPTYDSSQGFAACVGYVEPYYSVNAGNSLTSAMTAWGIAPGGDLTNIQWESDHGWDAYANSLPPNQFSMDTCEYAPLPRQPRHDITCH
ncbi:MAG TPA: hypothetical protein VGD37_20755 [Kofleriaceae bacterium]